MTLAQIFADNLSALRRRAGLSQERLAQKAGLSVSYVSMLERGARTAPLTTIELLCKVLDASPAYMLQRNAHPPAPQRAARRRS